MKRLARVAIAAVLALPGVAVAQDPPITTAEPDPIAALIAEQGGAEIDEDTAEGLVPSAAEAAPPPVGYVPSYARPSPSGLDRPVMIHETGLSPDGPPSVSELTYESRIRGGVAAAQGLQGPLDGAWTLNDAGGGKVYAFQMVDPGAGLGDLEGAWRDLRRGQGIGAVGLIAAIERDGSGGIIVRFYPRDPGQPVVAQLAPTMNGGWSGTLFDGGLNTPVTLVRDGPAPATYAVIGVSSASALRPYDPTVRAAPARKAPAKATAKGKKKKVVAKKGATKKKTVAKKPAAKIRTAKK